MTETVISPSERDLRQEWETPEDFMAVVRDEFRPNLDVCAIRSNSKCETFYGPQGYYPDEDWDTEDPDHPFFGAVDGLSQGWDFYERWNGERPTVAWCNPGFSNVLPWLQKAAEESYDNGVESLVVTHASHAADWWQFSMAHATECRLLTPRVQYKAPPGIKQTSNPRDGALWVFRSHWHRKTGAHIYVWNWKESEACQN